MNLHRNHPAVRAYLRSQVVYDKNGTMYHMSIKHSLTALYEALDEVLV